MAINNDFPNNPPQPNSLRLYMLNNPTYIGEPQRFQIGYIDNDYALTDITSNAAVEIIEPTGIDIYDGNSFLVNGNSELITVRFKVTYSTAPVTYFSICLVQPLKQITQDELYNTFVSYLPQGVYNLNPGADNPAYAKAYGTVEALYQLYSSIKIQYPNYDDFYTVVNQFFPSSGDPAWEQMLVGTNSLYYQPNTDYASLLTLFYQTNTNNNTNAYYYTLNISEYIYYRLGQLFYVYVGQDVFDIAGAFILDLNSLGQCVLQGSNSDGISPQSVVVYIINGSTLPAGFQDELNIFIRRITPSALNVTVNYDETFATLGLTDIGNTYWRDPRQNRLPCIQFNPGNLDQALGYTGNGSTANITDFTLTLSPDPGGNNLTLGQTYTVTLTPTYSIPTQLQGTIESYASFFSEDENVLDLFYSAGVESIIAGNPGATMLTVYLGAAYHTYNYTVS